MDWYEQHSVDEAYEKKAQEILKKDICPDCGHSLKDNNHGPDQNDYQLDLDTDELVYMGSCTYCKECNGENLK